MAEENKSEQQVVNVGPMDRKEYKGQVHLVEGKTPNVKFNHTSHSQIWLVAQTLANQ